MKTDERSKQLIKRILSLVLLFLFGFGALCFFAIGRMAFALAVPSPSAVTDGMIIEYREGRRISRTSRETTRCTISYEVEGKKYYNRSTGCDLFAGEGDAVRVVYNVNDPQKSSVDNRWFVNLFGIAALFLFGGAAWLIRNLIRDQRQTGAAV